MVDLHDLAGKLNFFNRKKQAEPVQAYRCWICGEVEEDPMVYLLHLHLCNMKHGNYDFAMSKDEQALEEETVKVQ